MTLSRTCLGASLRCHVPAGPYFCEHPAPYARRHRKRGYIYPFREQATSRLMRLPLTRLPGPLSLALPSQAYVDVRPPARYACDAPKMLARRTRNQRRASGAPPQPKALTRQRSRADAAHHRISALAAVVPRRSAQRPGCSGRREVRFRVLPPLQADTQCAVLQKPQRAPRQPMSNCFRDVGRLGHT